MSMPTTSSAARNAAELADRQARAAAAESPPPARQRGQDREQQDRDQVLDDQDAEHDLA